MRLSPVPRLPALSLSRRPREANHETWPLLATQCAEQQQAPAALSPGAFFRPKKVPPGIKHSLQCLNNNADGDRKMWQKIKLFAVGTGYLWAFIGLACVVLLISLYLIKGGVWLGKTVFPLSILLTQLAFAASIFIFLPLSFIRRTYGFSAGGLTIASMVIGVGIWIWALLLTYHIWGAAGVFIGLFMMGVGVVPVALVATMVKGMWGIFGQLLLALALMWGMRIYAYHVSQKAMRDSIEALR
jgi:hypothetical protein